MLTIKETSAIKDMQIRKAVNTLIKDRDFITARIIVDVVKKYDDDKKINILLNKLKELEQ